MPDLTGLPKRELTLPELKRTQVERIALDRSGLQREFDSARQRAMQTESSSLQQGKDAIARRAAQLGNAPSGAMIKLEQQAQDESANRLQQANREIDAGQSAEMRRIGEMETALNIQREDAQAARDIDIWKTDLATAVQKYGMEVDNDFKTIGLNLDAWAKGMDAWLKTETLRTANDQTSFENTENMRTNVISTIISLKNSGVPAGQIGPLLTSIGYDFEALGIDPNAITGIEGLTAPVPKPSSDNLVGLTAAPKGVTFIRQSDGSYRGSDGEKYYKKDGKYVRNA